MAGDGEGNANGDEAAIGGLCAFGECGCAVAEVGHLRAKDASGGAGVGGMVCAADSQVA